MPCVSVHMAGESTCDETGSVTHGYVESGYELTPSNVAWENEGVYGRCWELQNGEAGTMSVRGRLCNCLTF